jgi:hypothetical protein
MTVPPRGAYGFRLEGVEAAHPLLVPAEPDWPALRLATQLGFDSGEPEQISEDSARLRLPFGGSADVDWARGDVMFTLRRRAAAGELVHPHLGPVAAFGSQRRGRESFHAGAVVLGDGAWAVMGAKGAGKSTLLAWLALSGHRVLVDDVLVVDEECRALAGPRAIDLREGAARGFGVGEPIGAPPRRRYRMLIGAVPASVPLRGFIRLAWGDVPTVVRVPVAWRPAALAACRAVRLAPRDPNVLVQLSALPMVELRRPREWEQAADAAERLLDALAV